LHSAVTVAAGMIADGDVEGGLASFIDWLDGAGTWQRLPAAAQQELRDNAHTLMGQASEQRQPYTRMDAESIRVPTLFVGGANTPGLTPVVLRALATHVPGARLAIIPNATHVMFEQQPVRFCAVVLEFLQEA
jgi:pimeloyl-ACP methyl ester carboxylesterase